MAWARLAYDIHYGQGPQRGNPQHHQQGQQWGRTTGALGLAPTTATEGLATEDGPAVEERPTAATSAVGDPVKTEEGPAAGEDGPWSTRDL